MSSNASTETTEQVSNRTFLAVSITLACLAAVFVVARLIANRQRKANTRYSHIDDVATVLALAFLAASVAGFNELIIVLSDPTTTLHSLLKLGNALNWVGALMLWGCKVPILILYVSLFGIYTWVRIVSYTIVAVTGTIFLIMASYVTAKCTGNIDVDPIGFLARCQAAYTRAGFTAGLVSTTTDVLTFVLPIPVIARLHLPTHKKIGIGLVFMSGLAAIAASAVSTSYKWKSLRWSTSGGTNDMICTIVECAVALMVACVPGIYGLWSHSIVPSAFYSKLSSTFSQIFLVGSRASKSGVSHTSPKSNRSRPSTGSENSGRGNNAQVEPL